MKNILHRLALSLLLILPVVAHATGSTGAIAAHPTLWTVHGKTGGTVYLFGAIHLLPLNIAWRRAEVDDAMAASGSFVFEAPTDASGAAEVKAYVAAHGMLPDGVTLSSLLPPAARKEYEDAVAKAQLPPAMVDREQPWLAAITLEVAMMMHQNYAPDAGVDREVAAYATAHGKPLRYLETIGQQMALMDPPDRKLAVKEFVVALKSLRDDPAEIGAMVDAWSHGDQPAIDRIMNGDLAREPGAKKLMLDDRNKAWVTKIEAMLAEPQTVFITVGAAHLAGPGGVPALLRKAGYRVDGP
ncbi:MAG TPA: TraB/GumN family protein [Rhizomicrobium sp.]|jgi:hypothetical protein|nr:TraB/GumN family protein [Rhizomicrobium sp.]